MQNINEFPLGEALARMANSLESGTHSKADLNNAKRLLGKMSSSHKELCRSIASGAAAAEVDLIGFGLDFSVQTSADALVKTAEESGADEARVRVARSLVVASESAMAAGMWVEADLIRAIAWTIAEPTGYPTACLRAEVFLPPRTAQLREIDGGNMIVGASVQFAYLSKRLATVVKHGGLPKSEMVS